MKKNKKKEAAGFFNLTVITAIAILSLIIVTAVFAPLFTSYDPDAINLAEGMLKPSFSHFLGTDPIGHDIYTRLLYGGRTTIVSAIGVILISAGVGIPIGILCGYFGGMVDNIIMKIWELILAFPSLLLAFILVAAFGKGASKAVIATGIVYIPMISKLARSLCVVEKTKTYVEAAKSFGYSDFRIMFLHILPNCIPTIMAEVTVDFGYAVLSLASLSFLGLGVQAPQSDWGTMLEEGMQYITNKPLMAMAPCIMIVLTVVSINVLSDQIQIYLDKDLRKLPTFQQYRKKRGITDEE